MGDIEDAMPDSLDRRRWDDVVREIGAQVQPAVSQALVPYRLTVEETARDVTKLKTVVFGDTALGLRGLVGRLEAMELKLDALLDQGKERQVMLHGLWRTAEITRWIVVFLGSVLGVAVALNALGVIHL